MQEVAMLNEALSILFACSAAGVVGYFIGSMGKHRLGFELKMARSDEKFEREMRLSEAKRRREIMDQMMVGLGYTPARRAEDLEALADDLMRDACMLRDSDNV